MENEDSLTLHFSVGSYISNHADVFSRRSFYFRVLESHIPIPLEHNRSTLE